MSCKATVSLKFCYTGRDVEGNALNNIKGMRIEVLRPGACEWETAGEVAYPVMTFDYAAPEDGQYSFRYRQLNHSVTQKVGVGTCVSVSAPSPTVSVTVDAAKPQAPQAGPVVIDCPECHEKG